MGNIESTLLLDRPLQLTAVTDLEISTERSITVDDGLVIRLSEEHIEQIEDTATASLNAYGGTEITHVQNLIGRPTAVARVDCTIDPVTQRVFAYETDERPAGMGITDEIGKMVAGVEIGKQILGHFEQIFGEPPVVKRHPSEKENDDGMLLKVEVTPEKSIRPKRRPVLARGNPRAFQGCADLTTAVADHSVSTISDEGKRQYRMATGHARLLLPTSPLPEGSFAAKTLQGSQAKGVGICLTNSDAARLGKSGGHMSRELIKAIVAFNEPLMAEPFVPGVEVVMPDHKRGRLIMRVFCLVDSESVKVIGGTFVARPDHVVHGSSDAVAGLVTVD